MTNSQNLESLIAQHDALKAENERLQTENLALKKQVHCQYVAFCEGYNDRPTEPCTNCIVPAQAPAAEVEAIAPQPDLSFTAHDDAVSNGCQMCGNEHKSLNEQGYCSSCWTVWNS